MKQRKRKGPVSPIGDDVQVAVERAYRETPGLRDEVAEEMAGEVAAGLVKARTARGMSQRALARTLGVSQPAIAKLESGRAKDVKLSTVMRYAHAVGSGIRLQIIQGEETARRRVVREANKRQLARAAGYAVRRPARGR